MWSEAAVDPEMLGKAFESLMAAPDRKTSGAFYTPQVLVEQLATSALASALSQRRSGGRGRQPRSPAKFPAPGIREHCSPRRTALRVLDPACGSGAFLVHVLERPRCASRSPRRLAAASRDPPRHSHAVDLRR